jgi:arabinogalactan oligomer/maltooligosaccharide transport system permease protein
MDAGGHRKRFLLGLALSLLLGLGLEYALLAQILQNEAAGRAARLGIVTLQSFVEIVQKAPDEDTVRVAVTDLAKGNPAVKMIRVIKGVKLIASTSAQDTGEKAAPRRLARDEKDAFDLGQRLRAALLTNQEEGAARKEEIDIATTASGGLVLSGPIEEDGAAVGYVQIETPPAPAAPAPGFLLPAAVLAASLLIFAVASLWFRENRPVMATLSIILLVACLAGYGHYAKQALISQTQSTQNAVIAAIRRQAESGETALKQLAGQMAVTLSRSWDVDVFRHPRGLISAGGTSVQSEEARLESEYAMQLRKALLGIGVLSLGVLLFVGLGGAYRLKETIVRNRQAYTYTAPAMIGMLLLVFFPFFYGITLSFTDSSLYNTDKSIREIWVGVKNYVDILGDFSIVRHTDSGIVPNYSNFYYTLFFTIIWTVANVTLGVTVGLILALILNTKGLAMRPLYRVLLIFPWAMPSYITALIWKGMFHQQFGVINQMIQIFGGQPLSWFEKPWSSFLTVLTTNGWLSFPFMMVVSLGALQSISADLYEAARVDGATKWQQFKAITLPSLKPALVPAVILSVVWTFNMFNIIFLVSQGEPAGSTEILITQAYKIAFQKYQYGYAAAYSTVIFLILLVYGSIQNKVTRATESIAGG